MPVEVSNRRVSRFIFIPCSLAAWRGSAGCRSGLRRLKAEPRYHGTAPPFIWTLRI
jgi:hypothetical protein